MKIAVCGPSEPDAFADNVADTLRRMGHDVHSLGAARPPMRVRQLSNLVELLADNRRAIDKFRQRRMVKRVQEIRPDILLTIDRRLHPTVIKAAHQVGAKVALWFPDHTGTMANHDMFVAGYDRIYLKNPVLVDQLRDVQGLPVRYMPEAANSSWHRSILPYGAERAVVVAGNIHPTRALLLDRLVGDGIPVRIYGAALPSWIDFPRLREAHTGEYIARQRKADVFRSAVAVLNNLHPAEDAGMNCRLFEAAASGRLSSRRNAWGSVTCSHRVKKCSPSIPTTGSSPRFAACSVTAQWDSRWPTPPRHEPTGSTPTSIASHQYWTTSPRADLRGSATSWRWSLLRPSHQSSSP